jgi:putative transposase
VSFWQLYYHLIWATKRREPVIGDEAADLIRRSIQSVCTERRVIVHSIGVMPDHVHLAASVPPRISISEFARLVKGGTSHLINRSIQQPVGDWFFWQPEYGVLSFGKRSLESVNAYVENQATHHSEGNLWPLYERLIDEQYERAATRSLEEAL